MRRKSKVLAATVASLAVIGWFGCSGGGPVAGEQAETASPSESGAGGEPASDRITLSFVPDDLTTDVGSSPLLVRVAKGGVKVDADTLADVAAQVRLVGPDGQDIPHTVAVPDIDDLADSTSPVASVTIVPDAPLAAGGWYALRIDDFLDMGFETSEHLVEGSGARARFRVESFPTVRRVHTMLPPAEPAFAGAPAGAVVKVELTEMVDERAAGEHVEVVVTGADTPCVQHPAGGLVRNGADVSGFQPAVPELVFRCGDDVQPLAEVAIHFANAPALGASAIVSFHGDSEFTFLAHFPAETDAVAVASP